MRDAEGAYRGSDDRFRDRLAIPAPWPPVGGPGTDAAKRRGEAAAPSERSRLIMTQLQRPAPRGPDEKLTIAEVCAELKISRSTFYDWRAKRRGPRCITLPNGSLRIRRRDLDRWLGTREDAA
jgi:predicted DNA-binding transcriptional regulator AlpA